MSILAAEYDVEIAKRIYAEEQVEEKTLEIAKGMLLEGDSIEKIIKLTKISFEAIKELQKSLRAEG